MFPILYENQNHKGFGYGMLSDCTSCVIKETLNGDYSLEMSYPLGGVHSEEITEGRLIKAQRDNSGNMQFFRISTVSIDYITREMTVYAPHISRDLAEVPAAWASYVYLTKIAYVISDLNSDDFFDVPCDFTFLNSGGFVNETNRLTEELPLTCSVFNLLIGDTSITNSVLEKSPVELEFDNFDVKFWKSRGTGQNVTVRYGKNLTALNSETSVNVFPYAYVPYYYKSRTVSIYGDIAKSDYYNDTGALTRTAEVLDVAQEIDEWLKANHPDWTEESIAGSTYEQTTIANMAHNIAVSRMATIDASRYTNGGVVIDFDFLDLAQASQYWSGARPEVSTADLGDSVTVVHGGFEATTEIIEVEYDVLKERYNKLTAGQLNPSLSDTIKKIAQGAN